MLSSSSLSIVVQELQQQQESMNDTTTMESSSVTTTLLLFVSRLMSSLVQRDDELFADETTRRYLPEDTTKATTTADSPLAIFSAVMSNILLFFLIFGLSATVNMRDLKHQLTNKFALGTGVLMQFLIMPLLGFVSIMIFTNCCGLSYAMGISLLVVTASPGGSYSKWWCSLFNAELALSVAMTSVSSLLSIGLLPANLFLYGWLAYGVVLDNSNNTSNNGDRENANDDTHLNIVAALDFGAIFISLGVVMGAILSGLYVGYRFDSPTFHQRANYFGSFCGIALILFSVFLGSGAGGAETNFWSLPWSFYVATAFPCIVGMTLANIASRSLKLEPPEVVAISIECCYQNTAIATSVAVTMFSDPTERAEAVSVPLFYGFVEAFIIGIYCIWAWKLGWTKAPKNEKLCVVIAHTYEVHDTPSEHADDDGMVEINPHHDNLTWWQKCFMPRYPDYVPGESNSNGSPDSADKKKGPEDETRNRFYSADVTVSTNQTTPPGSPDVPTDSSHHPSSESNELVREISDLETPSLRNTIPVIDEVVDEDSDILGDSGTIVFMEESMASFTQRDVGPKQNTTLSESV